MSILIAGIGNIFFGDDAFGSEVARKLLHEAWPENVRVVDFGIRSIDLVYALADDYELCILIDAMQRGETAGTVSVIEPDREQIERLAEQPIALDGHTLDPLKVLASVRQTMGKLGRVLLVVCEPAYLGDDTGHLGLSEAVQSALPKAIEVVQTIVARALQEKQLC